MRNVRSAPGVRLLVVFSLTILAPGLVMAVLGARGIWRERHSIDDSLQRRLDYAATIAGHAFAEQMEWLHAQFDRGAPAGDVPGLSDTGGWAVVTPGPDGLHLHPADALPYELRGDDPPGPEVDRSPARRAHLAARDLKRAGRLDEAVRRWRELERAGGTIGTVPAELVAGFELAQIDREDAQRFRDRLISGRWRIDKARFDFYIGSEALHGVHTGDREAAILALGDAVQHALAGRRVVASANGVHVVFRRESPFAALVVPGHLLAALVPPAVDPDVLISRITADGHTLYRGPPSGVSDLRADRVLDAAGISWRVEVTPKDAATSRAEARRQADLYLGMLGLIFALFVSGGALIAQTVRRELQVARLKADFVATVSHEFRSPLTGVRQLAELLSRDRVPDEDRRRVYYELILLESERLGRLVEHVLDFARMEDGRKRYRMDAVETTGWLKGVAEEFARIATRTGHVLHASIPDRLPAITGDREALSTAVHNLLDNAVKYSPHAKTISLEADAADNRVRIAVRDRGVGIPAGQQSRVFEKFYRVDGELARSVKGVGLGLSLVRHIVESHGGTVSVDSREGEGSTFTIELTGAR